MARLARTLLPWLLGAFFIVGSLANALASVETRAGYVAWGYPSWFHYVTAALEMAAALLLFGKRTRLIGAGLGAAIMGAAAATLILHGDYLHALVPVTVLALAALVARAAFRQGRPRSPLTGAPPESANGSDIDR